MDQMIEDMIRQVDTLQSKFDGLVKPEVKKIIIDRYLALPGLVGFWPMSSVQRSTGNVYDLSGQSRTLTYNGNPTFGLYNNLVPYIDLDGTGDYFSRLDETDLDILGTETIYPAALRGLTMGCWAWCDSGSSDAGLINKGFTNAYSVTHHNGSAIYFYINAGGGAVNHNVSQGTGEWYNITCRFVPSTSMDIWLSGVKSSKVAGIPASIANVANQLEVGTASTDFDGKITLVFLCSCALPDSLIQSLYQQSRVLFGV